MAHLTPEQLAREKIDAQLTAAGGVIQRFKEYDRDHGPSGEVSDAPNVGRVPSPGVPSILVNCVSPTGDQGATMDKTPTAGLIIQKRDEKEERPVRAPGLQSATIPRQSQVKIDPLPRRLRRLHRVWPDRNGNISYLLTLCTENRASVLANESVLNRLVDFLLESPPRYDWFGRRFVIMPDHLHLIAHQGRSAVALGEWSKALKAVVAGLQRREELPVRSPGLQSNTNSPVGRVPLPGAPDLGPVPPPGVLVPGISTTHEFTRAQRTWRWQSGFHDRKFRTPEEETRKWEYVCLNPVRGRLVERPEQWPYGGEIFYDESKPRLIRGTPPLLETGLLIQDKQEPSREGTRPTS